MEELNDFESAYLGALLWASLNPDTGEPLDGMSLAPEALEALKRDCAAFQASNWEWLCRAGSPTQNGHDFFLTREGHGSGFWDRGYSKEVGEALTNAARAMGEVWPFVQEDGLVHFLS